MKIAVVGTHSTGKTTLIKKLATYLESQGQKIVLVSEVARLCPYPINENATCEAQDWIVENQIVTENKLDPASGIILCDRASFDGFAYQYRVYRNAQRLHDIAPWEEKVVAHAATYDYIFKTQKLDLPSVPDGQRSTDEAFRCEIDELLGALMDKHSIPYVSLPRTLDYTTHLNFILKTADLRGEYLSLQAATRDYHSTR